MVDGSAGVLLASTAISALHRRNAVPRALMTLMQHELGEARKATRAPACTPARVPGAQADLARLASDLEHTMLAPGTHDRVFVQYANDLRSAIARWDPASACAAQAQALVDVGNACEACHRDYR